MVRFTVSHSLGDLRKQLEDLQKQVPFALSRALNRTAFDIREQEMARMPKELDRPKPFTIRGVRVKKSTKRNLVAIVGLAEKQGEYLRFVIEGGTRTAKRRAIPVPNPQAMRLNKFGNMPRGKVGRLLEGKRSGAGSAFSGVPKGRPGAPEGIWVRQGRKGRDRLRLMAQWKPRVIYRGRRLRWYETAEKELRAKWDKHLAESIEFAIRTARDKGSGRSRSRGRR